MKHSLTNDPPSSDDLLTDAYDATAARLPPTVDYRDEFFQPTTERTPITWARGRWMRCWDAMCAEKDDLRRIDILAELDELQREYGIWGQTLSEPIQPLDNETEREMP